MYDVEAGVPREVVSELESGTNLLITGPPMSGKRELALELLTGGNGSGDGTVLVMTSESAAVVIEDLDRYYPELDWTRIGVVDCTGSDNRTITDVATRSATSSRDLTGISTAAARLLQQLSDGGVSQVRHGLISVSTLLEHLDPDTVFKFLHIYLQRIVETDGLGIFTIDDTAHDPRVIDTLASEFDGVIELHGVDTGLRGMRIRGLADAPDVETIR
jgi:KaiC/GvpD/RAD55 family RecA-like ATPase